MQFRRFAISCQNLLPLIASLTLLAMLPDLKGQTEASPVGSSDEVLRQIAENKAAHTVEQSNLASKVRQLKDAEKALGAAMNQLVRAARVGDTNALDDLITGVDSAKEECDRIAGEKHEIEQRIYLMLTEQRRLSARLHTAKALEDRARKLGRGQVRQGSANPPPSSGDDPAAETDPTGDLPAPATHPTTNPAVPGVQVPPTTPAKPARK